MSARLLRWLLILLALSFLAAGCGEAQAPISAGPNPENASDAKTLERVLDSGPLRVVLRVAPESPLIGDPITLSIEVSAPEGVEVKMPPYVEAVGRFESTAFATPNPRILADGQTLLTQQYTLQAPMSGEQTIPAQVVEYIDRRPDRPNPNEAFGEAQTEPIALTIRSSLSSDAQDPQLHGLRPAFDADEVAPPEELAASQQRWIWAALAGGALMLGFVAWLLWRWMRRPKPVPTPFEIAWAELLALQAAGVPDAKNADAWYVRLTSAVRQYIEGCFQIPALELTTEEFLQMTARNDIIPKNYQTLLASLLMSADRVKFAAYAPQATESKESLDAAMRFVNETHLQQNTQQSTLQNPTQPPPPSSVTHAPKEEG